MSARARMIVRAGVAVVLGVVTSIAVAWGIAQGMGRWFHVSGPTGLVRGWIRTGPDGQRVLVEQYARPGSVVQIVLDEQEQWIPGLDGPSFASAVRKVQTFGDLRTSARWPTWGFGRESVPAPPGSGSQYAFGWPVEVLWRECSSEWSSEYRPVWLGLLVDVPLYTLPWLALMFGATYVQRRRRAAGGKCRACGYDLRGLARDVCPECGRAVVMQPPMPAAVH